MSRPAVVYYVCILATFTLICVKDNTNFLLLISPMASETMRKVSEHRKMFAVGSISSFKDRINISEVIGASIGTDRPGSNFLNRWFICCHSHRFYLANNVVAENDIVVFGKGHALMRKLSYSIPSLMLCEHFSLVQQFGNLSR